MSRFPLIAATVLALLVACGVQSTPAPGVGNGSSGGAAGNGPGCSDAVLQIGVGGGSAGCGPSWYYPSGNLGPFVITSASANQMSSDATAIACIGNPLNGWSKAWFLYGVYSAGVYQPGLNTVDLNTQTAGTAAQISSSLVTTSGSYHELGSCVPGNFGSALAMYGGIDPFTGGPAGWNCGAAGGGAGTSYRCQPLKLIAQGDTPANVNARTEYNAPTTGISELSVVRIPPSIVTPPTVSENLDLMCGQIQWGGTWLSQGGAGGCLLWQWNSATDGVFYTKSSTTYDPFTTAISLAQNGQIVFPGEPHSNAWTRFTVTAVTASSAYTVTFNWPSNGEPSAGTNCALSGNTGTNTVTQQAAAIVASFNSFCSQSPSYHAISVAGVPGAFDIEAPAAQDIQTSGFNGAMTTSSVTNQTITNQNLQTLHLHFQFGGVYPTRSGPVALYDVQHLTQDSLVSAHSGSSFADALVAYKITGVNTTTGAVTYTDLTGANPITISPNNAIANASASGGLNGAGSGGTCTATGSCESPYLVRPPSAYPASFNSFVYDWSEEQDPDVTNSGKFPVLSDHAITQDANGNYWIAYLTNDTTGLVRLAALRVTTSTGFTDFPDNGFVDSASMASGNFGGIGLSTGASGILYLAFVTNIGASWGCTASPGTGTGSSCLVLYTKAPPYNAGWTRTQVYSYTNSAPSGAPGWCRPTEDQALMLCAVAYDSNVQGSTKVAAFVIPTP